MARHVSSAPRKRTDSPGATSIVMVVERELLQLATFGVSIVVEMGAETVAALRRSRLEVVVVARGLEESQKDDGSGVDGLRY
jgi:hypothetical protein